MPGEGVALDFGEPLLAYGGSGLAVHSAGLACGGVLYAEAGASVRLSAAFEGTPPAGKKHDAFAASVGELAKSGDGWALTMPAGDVAIAATFADATAYEIWAAASGVSGAWDETDALGIHNVFRYAFDKPTGAFENPPLLDIAFAADGTVLVLTPPLVNTTGFDFSLLATDDLDGANPATFPLDPSGTNAVPASSSSARFFRLRAAER